MTTRGLQDIYNEYIGARSGDISRDLSEHGLPSDVARAVALHYAEFLEEFEAAEVHKRRVAFLTGLMVGVDWHRGEGS